MERGSVRRSGSAAAIGRWVADASGITVTSDDPGLRAAAESVLTTPQVIPVHAAERFEFAGHAAPTVQTPSTIQLLALFALEMEARGCEVVPDED